MSATLPPGFEALEPFAETWGDVESPLTRLQLRQRSAAETLKALYARGAPMLGAIFDHLDRFDVAADLPAAELRLYNVAHGIIEAGQFVEAYGGKPYQATFQSTDQIEDYWFGFVR